MANNHNKYPTLLSPITIGNMTARNRMVVSLCEPHFVQGTEPFPAESMIAHYANKAKSGAGIVACGRAQMLSNSYETKHFATYNFKEGPAQNMMSQCVDAVHFHGAKCQWIVNCPPTPGFDVSEGIPSHAVEGDGTVGELGKEMPKEMIEWMIQQYVEEAKLLKSFGVDMFFMHHAYRMFTPARFLSPLTNKRTDEYGGPIQNRARVILEICDRIKDACGRNFPIEISVSAFEHEGGTTLEEMLEFVRLAEGKIDVLQLRTPDIDPNHPIGLSPTRYPNLEVDRIFKQTGTSIKITAIGGFFDDFELHEKILANGDADLIGMARSFISNPDYANIIYEDRMEDLVPCIKCNRCHTSGVNKPWVSNCSVNPRWGMEGRVDSFISPPRKAKKVAVIGGGPGGMKTAIEAANRGHQVTLYEKTATLGGQLKHTDYPDFKWPLRKFKNYLVSKVSENPNITIQLGVEATPDMLKPMDYDEVIVAIGSAPLVPPIPGITGKNVIGAIDVYGCVDLLAQDIVVIGGGEIGTETAIYLAREGKNVTILEMRNDLCLDSTPIHYRTMVRDAWRRQEGLDFHCNARVTGVYEDRVTYIQNGEEKSIPCGTVVCAAGMKNRRDEAWGFNGVGHRTRLVGDCETVGNVQTTIRSAYSTGVSL